MLHDAPRTLLVIAAAPLVACATSGHAWVQEPEPGWAAVSSERERSYGAALAANVTPNSETTALAADETPAPRPRLDRVVSLGESTSARAASETAAVAAPAPAPLVVNIVNYGASGYAPGGVYYSAPLPYGSPRVGPAAPRPSSAASATPALGGDWRPPPSHGPTFPYHTAPASPWERGR